MVTPGIADSEQNGCSELNAIGAFWLVVNAGGGKAFAEPDVHCAGTKSGELGIVVDGGAYCGDENNVATVCCGVCGGDVKSGGCETAVYRALY